jgi:pilus assembly protein CpaE
MSSSLSISSILTITTNESVRNSVHEIINATEGFENLVPESPDEEIIEVVFSTKPDYILLDMDYGLVDPLKLIDSVSAQFPEVVIIAILSQDHLLDSQEVILAGARAILLSPFTSDDLVGTLHRIKELLGRRSVIKTTVESPQALVSTRGTFVVISPKGGVGVSSVATNLALSLFEEVEEEVLLMDGKLLFGHLDVMLNLRTQNTVSELIAHVAALDEGLIRDVVSQHVSGLHLLPAPLTITSGQGIRPDDMYRLLVDLQTVFKYIVIDGGNFLNDMAVTYMDAANKIVLVVNPDIASLRDASQFFEVCRTLSYPREKIQVVVNQYDKRDGLSISDVEKSLQVEVLGTIPLDRKTSLQSINRGIPVTLQRTRTPLRRAYQSLAKDLLNVINTSSIAKLPGASRSDALSKSSRLG